MLPKGCAERRQEIVCVVRQGRREDLLCRNCHAELHFTEPAPSVETLDVKAFVHQGQSQEPLGTYSKGHPVLGLQNVECKGAGVVAQDHTTPLQLLHEGR